MRTFFLKINLLSLFLNFNLFAQINLVHTFPQDNAYDYVFAYSNNESMYYVQEYSNNQIVIYNSNFTIYKTVNIPISSNLTYSFWYDKEDFPYSISKNIFNNDDLLELLVVVYNPSSPNPESSRKLYLINEDGLLLYNFTPNSNDIYGEDVSVYFDPSTGFNKILVNTFAGGHKVYSLPSNSLNLEEEFGVQALSIYPNPSEGIVNIVNPRNQIDLIELIDLNGRILKTLRFSSDTENIRFDISEFMSGTYIIKIGNLSTKYIKK